jgi:hypothetical protein
MFSISKKLIPPSDLHARRASVPGESVAADSHDSKDAVPSRSHTSTSGTVTTRDLCVVILRDTLRMYGIPLEWVAIEVINLSKHAAIVRLQINFVILHWHEGLLMYAPALQKQFLESLQNFDPVTDHSKHSVCWKFSAKCNCPFTEIPGPSYWEMAQPSDEPFQSANAAFRFDLPPLNPDRKREQYGDFPSTIPLNL